MPKSSPEHKPRLWERLEDASDLRFMDNRTRVDSPEAYLGWHAERVMQRRLSRKWEAGKTPRARVDHGRWICDCVEGCGRGMFTHPAWRIACCTECGAVYRGIIFPEDVPTITSLLLARPNRENQNWLPDESITWLRIENLAHRI